MFQQLIGDAARLTTQGDLQAATAAIQRALGVTHPVGREWARAPVTPPDETVIDVQAREVGIPLPSHPAPEQERVVKGSYASQHGQRQWRLYVPPAYTGQALPLVVMLHGCTQDPEDFARGTGMDEAARRQGFFVLYPAQDQGANPQRCWNWFKHSHQQRDRGEPALLAGLTRRVMADYGIDARRVYVAGLSAGGAMAAILGEAYPDLYAAVGIHSGLAAGAANDLPSALAAMQGGAVELRASTGLAGLPGMPGAMMNRPTRSAPAAGSSGGGARVPTIVFHGDQDHTVHPVNAEHIIAACTAKAANDEALNCSEERARSSNGRVYTRRLHADERGRFVAEHWIVHGAGHAWSGGSSKGSYTDAAGPDATGEMLRFFFLHTLHTGHNG
jgi:poly(hydroxyalkanoate) depolymerase family esterase